MAPEPAGLWIMCYLQVHTVQCIDHSDVSSHLIQTGELVKDVTQDWLIHLADGSPRGQSHNNIDGPVMRFLLLS